MTDTDLADDIALISDNLDKSQLLLERDEPAATEVGLYINSIKTEYMACTLRQQGDLATPRQLKNETGGRLPVPRRLIRSNEELKDLEIRKAKAWTAQQANSGVEIQPQQRSEHTFL